VSTSATSASPPEGSPQPATEPVQEVRKHRPRRPRKAQPQESEREAVRARPEAEKPPFRRRQHRPEDSGRPGREARPPRPTREDRPDRDPELRAKYIKSRASSGERAPDPDSPFAKLAKLKEQLEAGVKEPR
jgi:ATP-dependent RNA helicase SUPV3L1/SUV3